jgi:hypothetical protein
LLVIQAVDRIVVKSLEFSEMCIAAGLQLTTIADGIQIALGMDNIGAAECQARLADFTVSQWQIGQGEELRKSIGAFKLARG